jgi:V8-like Glu-specific endopeptidase
MLQKMTYPFSAIGLIQMYNPSASTKLKSFCTGWLISPTVVVTAAHCVFDLKTMLPIKPEYLTFMPRVWGGTPSGGYKVKAIAFPGWYAVMLRGFNCEEDIARWDMGVLHLSEGLQCAPGCYLRPSIIVGRYAYTKNISMAGYGRPAATQNQMNVSRSCAAKLLPNMAYSYSKCASYHGHSGAPYWPSAQPYESNRNMTGIPKGVAPFSWPAFGVHSRKSPAGDNAMMCKFTAAHLKWLYRAGLKTALACTADEKGDANCATYKFLST